MLRKLPWALISSILACVLIVTCFITSSDSTTYVIYALLTRDSKRSPTRQHVIWGVTEGAFAAVLLGVGGEAALEALHTASISAALPFSIILLLICYSFFRALRREFAVEGVNRAHPSSPIARLRVDDSRHTRRTRPAAAFRGPL